MSDTNETEEQTLSYADLYSQLLLSTELIITIPVEDVDRIKNGIKNCKARQHKQLKDEGVSPEETVLIFEELPSPPQFLGCCDLRIILRNKGTVTVKRVVIPDGDF